MRLALLCLALFTLPVAAHAPPLEQLPDTMLAQGPDVTHEMVVDEAPAPAKGLGDRLLEFASPSGVATIFGLVASAIGGLVWFTSRRKRLVALAAYHAFHIIEDIGNELEGEDGFDKTARYLQKVDEFMRANGWRPLKPGEVDSAKMQASALHGAEIAKAKVAAAAAVAAAEASKLASP
jgi:hypothetical protein